MMDLPRCRERGCAHFVGVVQKDGTEGTEIVACAAFPNGIPDDIAYGDNLHLVPVAGDHGIQYEKDPEL
jgi:hypothetical protein